jgi:phospholipid/cholesterol/gamma-HCH transport system ATP-binding protein
MDAKPAAEPATTSEGSKAPRAGSTGEHAGKTHIAAKQLSKQFGETVVLSDVNLDIHRGNIAVILGGSGAGKTTLMRILIGLERPTSGSVTVNDQDIAKMGERELNTVRQKFGMVFQYSALLDSLDVLENVAFPLREHKKLKEKEIRDMVKEKLAILGLQGTEDRFPSQLSGGMRKRVALARALMLEPEVIMYDEPTSGLDPITCRMVDELILETRERFGVTSVVISHDMAGAVKIADQLYLLADGHVVAEGTPGELVRGTNKLLHDFLDASGISADKLDDAEKRTQTATS